jgi:hypothetical protein
MIRFKEDFPKRLLFLITLIIILLHCPYAIASVVTGTVYDVQSGAPVSSVTIRVEGTGQSMMTNATGQYRLKLQKGAFTLKFSHIAYYTDSTVVQSGDSAMVRDINLRPSVQLLKGIKVYTRAYDPAQKIILEAIARKDSILAKMKSISFEVYTRLVARNRKKADSVNIMFITETQSISYYQWPDKLKEVIISRRQSANWQPEMNTIVMGWFIDLNENRIDFGRTSVVSPTARDALDYYNYYLLDTVYIDNRPIFRLEIEPKTESTPLFVGTIDIADSSFAVAGIDVGLNKAAEIPFLKNFKYGLQYAGFENARWMPVESHTSADIDIDFPGVPPLSLDIVAAMHDYNFDVSHPGGTFDYTLEVAEDADKPDTSGWDSRQSIPLTSEETKGYKQIDSLIKSVPAYKKVILGAMSLTLLATSQYDMFHFNRVEGFYLGLGGKLNVTPRLGINIKSGWAFSDKYWQNRLGADYTISQSRRLKVGAEYHNEMTRRPTIISRPDGNPTVPALFDKSDPYDYFREEGFSGYLETKVISRRVIFSITGKNFSQHSINNKTDYGLFSTDKHHRPNPAIVNGKYRTVTAGLNWETREWIKNKKRDESYPSFPYTKVSLRAELSSPDLMKSDFDFRRYSLWFSRRQRLLGLGVSSLFLYAGSSDGKLPPQRYFTIDCAAGVFYDGLAFKTMGQKNFVGNRTLVAYLEHDFGRFLFLKSGLPLIKKIPYTVSVYGGLFWTDFRNHPSQPGDSEALLARHSYREIGFSVGNLPLLLKLYFTWQLSRYDTNRFSFVCGFGL